MADILFDIRNSFYLGNMQNCINNAQHIKANLSPEQKLEKDMYMYRAYMAQKKYGLISDEIKPNMSSQLKSIKLLANYLSGDSNVRADILKGLESRVSNTDVNAFMEILIYASIYYYENIYESALRILHSCEHIECCAMILEIYIKLDRIDLARKELKRMQEMDDDCTLTQLAHAWINLAIGGEKLQDAYYIFQELSEKYGSTPLTINGEVVALIGQSKYDESESLLQQAIDKDSNHSETLINSIVISQVLGRTFELTNRYISQLKDSNNNHPLIKELCLKEKEFEHCINQYKINL